jgi:hypothetical protein
MPTWRKTCYWLPRLLLLVFAGGLFLPLPRYVRGMAQEEYMVWLSQVLWVLGLALAGGLVVVLVLCWRRRQRADQGP